MTKQQIKTSDTNVYSVLNSGILTFRNQEHLKALETVRKMLIDGMDISLTVKYTGLSLEEVEKLTII